jgi:transposase
VQAPKSSPHSGVIELEIAGVQLRVRGQVDEASLCNVLRALRQAR